MDNEIVLSLTYSNMSEERRGNSVGNRVISRKYKPLWKNNGIFCFHSPRDMQIKDFLRKTGRSQAFV